MFDQKYKAAKVVTNDTKVETVKATEKRANKIVKY